MSDPTGWSLSAVAAPVVASSRTHPFTEPRLLAPYTESPTQIAPPWLVLTSADHNRFPALSANPTENVPPKLRLAFVKTIPSPVRMGVVVMVLPGSSCCIDQQISPVLLSTAKACPAVLLISRRLAFVSSKMGDAYEACSPAMGSDAQTVAPSSCQGQPSNPLLPPA